MRQIAVVRPEIIVALGPRRRNICWRFGFHGQSARTPLRFQPLVHPRRVSGHDPGFSTRLVVTYHPAYLLRDPRQKKEAWLDLQRVMKYLGMSVPQRSLEHPE